MSKTVSLTKEEIDAIRLAFSLGKRMLEICMDSGDSEKGIRKERKRLDHLKTLISRIDGLPN